MEAMAATQGVYSRLNTSREAAVSVLSAEPTPSPAKKIYIMLTTLSLAM